MYDFSTRFLFHMCLISCLLVYSENERSQSAFVTFKDVQGAETAVLLSVSFSSTSFYLLVGYHGQNICDKNDMELHKTFLCIHIRLGCGIMFVFLENNIMCYISESSDYGVCSVH